MSFFLFLTAENRLCQSLTYLSECLVADGMGQCFVILLVQLYYDLGAWGLKLISYRV